MKETTANTIATGQTWATHISGATLVYSGNISTLNNYVDIPTNYIYQGGNLIVMIEGTGCTTYGGCSVSTYSTITSDNKHAYAVTDTDIYPTTTTLTANTTRPNIKIYTDNPQVTASNYGISTYALHIANSSGYNIERCKFQAGNKCRKEWYCRSCRGCRDTNLCKYDNNLLLGNRRRSRNSKRWKWRCRRTNDTCCWN